MSAASELAVLMALRVRGRADAAQVARAAGCAEAEAVAGLDQAVARGAAAPAGDGSTVALTAAGREELARLLATESFDRVALRQLYERFCAADRDLKQAITAWQLADTATKSGATSGVAAAANGAGAIATALMAIAARLTPYAARFAAAASAIRAGDARFVASPRVDSLHQVWFELHEDLLVTLGRSRDA